MRICQKHWDALREAIKQRGLEHLVAQSGEAAVENIVAELQGTEKSEDYDPLMSCHWMIMGQATKMLGLEVMSPNEDGTPKCPVCAVVEAIEFDYINGPADAALDECRARGLAPEPS
jgi:hypothetical protein